MATLELPERLRPVLDAVVAVSEGYEGVYLVGGSVRDILLGEPNFDVDVVVEGDAIALAHALAERLEGRARAHRQFGTAVVLYGEEERVDVVTARSETYHAPAVLPTVEPGSIDEDLHRRDFTINAMAVSLKGENLGRLVDPFGGREDLEAGRIRILHDRSFVDDPDQDPPRDPLRGPLRLPDGRRDGPPRARVHRHGPRRRPFRRAPAR